MSEDKKILREQGQVKRIKAEIRKLRRLYSDFTREEKILPDFIVNEIAFMIVTLDDLKKKVNQDGVVTEMLQGAYSIDRENPALKSYNATIQRYNTLIKQLDEILNKSHPETANERDLTAFIAKKI